MTTEYQQTAIGKIPTAWKVVKIEDIAETSSGGTPSRERKEYYGGNILWFKSGELLDNIVYDSEEKISHTGLRNSSAKRLPKGTLLIAMYGATVGKTAILGVEATTNQAICAILPNDDTFDSRYLQYYIIFRRDQLISISSGGAQPNVSQQIIKLLRVPLPPIDEQRKIAEILSNVDDAIQRVDLAIEKTERLKKGLMQKLLTEGIGHKEFKETKIGKIPKEWKVEKLKDICTKITDGSHWSPKEVEESDYRIATVANLKETCIDLYSCKLISKEDYMRLAKEGDVPEKGDILFSKDGTVGISFSFKQNNQPIGVLSSIAIIRPNPQLLLSDFGAHALKSPNVFRQVVGRKTGTALRRIILNHIKTIRIPLPPLQEQRKIAEFLSTVDHKLELDKKRKKKLERIKKGLMNDLLTGKRTLKVAM